MSRVLNLKMPKNSSAHPCDFTSEYPWDLLFGINESRPCKLHKLLSDLKLLLCTIEQCCITWVMYFWPKGIPRESQPSTSGLTYQQMITPSGKDGNHDHVLFYCIRCQYVSREGRAEMKQVCVFSLGLECQQSSGVSTSFLVGRHQGMTTRQNKSKLEELFQVRESHRKS